MSPIILRTMICLPLTLMPLVSIAHGDDDGHEHTTTSATIHNNSDQPKRLADGSVFLPKPAQRQLQIRTQRIDSTEHHTSYKLNGEVMIDPQSGGLVQTTQGGQYTPPNTGIPQLGQNIQKGQVLGYVQKPQSPLERASQETQITQLKTQLKLGEKRLERIQQLADTLPQKELESAQSEVESLHIQIRSLQQGLQAREVLLAPLSGKIAVSQALSGKVFAEGDMVFEIHNPSVLRIVATWSEPGIPPTFSSGTVTSGHDTIELQYKGQSYKSKDQSTLLIFENRKLKSHQTFPTGQLLNMYAQTQKTQLGFAIPNSALVKDSANQTIVWVKTSPEHFEPRTVIAEPLTGNTLLVRQGLDNAAPIVTQGANLVNQIR